MRKSFRCPRCAGDIRILSPQRAAVVGCAHCGAVLDVTHPDARLIAEYEKRTAIQPLVPLGARGTLRGVLLECLGMLRRRVVIEGIAYAWDEYLLWNPYAGYRWLTEYQGHWTFVKPCLETPAAKVRVAEFEKKKFNLFQTSRPEVTYVLGEFTWEVKRGDRAVALDFVCPPFQLSKEQTEGEITWSIAEYLPGRELWEGFKLPGRPPEPLGVFACQPNPHASHFRGMTALWLAFMGATVLVQLLAVGLAQSRTVHTEDFAYDASEAEKSRVSKYFELAGRASNVLVEFDTNLSNHWAYFDCALIHEETGTAINFGREVEYYYGTDSDGAWTEGSASDSGYVPGVPSGRWYLRVEPETDAPTLTYRVRVQRDVPRWVAMWMAMAVLCVPYLWCLWRRYGFEYRRWQESDYPMGGGGGSDD